MEPTLKNILVMFDLILGNIREENGNTDEITDILKEKFDKVVKKGDYLVSKLNHTIELL